MYYQKAGLVMEEVNGSLLVLCEQILTGLTRVRDAQERILGPDGVARKRFFDFAYKVSGW
jgi:hypothetical protein